MLETSWTRWQTTAPVSWRTIAACLLCCTGLQLRPVRSCFRRSASLSFTFTCHISRGFTGACHTCTSQLLVELRLRGLQTTDAWRGRPVWQGVMHCRSKRTVLRWKLRYLFMSRPGLGSRMLTLAYSAAFVAQMQECTSGSRQAGNLSFHASSEHSKIVLALSA